MVKKTIHFMGILANVDSSILRMKLDRGFSVEIMSDNEASELVSRLEEIPLHEAHKKLFMAYRCLNVSERAVYVLHNMFEAEIDESKHIMNSAFSPMANFENEKVRGYLLDALRLMRLYKQGNICIPLWYYFLRENSTPQNLMTHWSGFTVIEELFSLGGDEMHALLVFLGNTKLPFQRDFLQLGFENFETSYDMAKPAASFLSLMISLESLLNPSDHEIRYRLSRNTGVLLGMDFNDSKSICTEVKGLYDKRSQLVHSGKAEITREDIIKLRHYVRESIKTIYRLDKDKPQIMEILDSNGFGSKIESNH